jgi:hypothetical protein
MSATARPALPGGARASMLVLLAAMPCLGGCATVACMLFSPVTVPLSLVRNWEPTEWWGWAVLPILVPYAFVVAPLTGMQLDLDFLDTGKYEHFGWILDPIAHLPGH